MTPPVPDPAALDLLARCLLYHYESAQDGEALRVRGHRVGRPGEVVPLHAPTDAEPG